MLEDFGNYMAGAYGLLFPIAWAWLMFFDGRQQAAVVQGEGAPSASPSGEARPSVLVACGRAPYQHRKDEKPSYYVTLRSPGGGTSTLWGVDLERALAAAGAMIGDSVKVRRVGSKEVTVPRHANGRVEWIATRRNAWEVNKLEAAR